MSGDRPVPASTLIVCLGTAPPFVQRLAGLLDRGAFRVIQASGGSGELATLCRRAGAALLIVEQGSLESIPWARLQTAIGDGYVRLLVIAVDIGESEWSRLFQLGCSGAIRSDATDFDLQRSISAVLRGELWMPRLVVSKFAREAQSRLSPRKLTPREREILDLIAEGLTNQSIADRLLISRETVRWHIRSIHSKIGAESREAAISYGRRRAASS